MDINKKIDEYLNEASMSKAEQVRKFAPGYIGGDDVAEKATDEEILKLVELLDKKADLYNRHIAPIVIQVEKIQKEINKRKK